MNLKEIHIARLQSRTARLKGLPDLSSDEFRRFAHAFFATEVSFSERGNVVPPCALQPADQQYHSMTLYKYGDL